MIPKLVIVLVCLTQVFSLNQRFLLQANSDALKDAFAAHFRIGTSVSPFELNQAAAFIKKHFNSITPENELKPDSILNQQQSQQRGNNVNPQVEFRSGTQQTLKFCEDNGIPLRGHTFVWHGQTPEWFFVDNFASGGNYVSKEIMNQRLENFIKNTFDLLKQQYPRLTVYSYDVCNEVFEGGGGGLRKDSRWIRIYGDDAFIVNAFTYARKYAPAGCKLYINDFNEYMANKTNDIVSMANKLKGMGLIDGIGMQSHLGLDFPSAAAYAEAMEKFVATGLEVQVTELDIAMDNGDANRQAQKFKEIFQIAIRNSAKIPTLTLWGTSDGVSWIKDKRPLLFDASYNPKAAYTAVMSLV